MQENEVKILEIDRKKVEARLLELGAKKIFEAELYAIYFDTKDMNFKKDDIVLRLRKEDDTNKLTFKKRNPDQLIKSEEEIEVEVSDFEMVRMIFKNLDYIEKNPLHKTRTSYILGNFRIEIDKYLEEYSFVPEFLEIEGPDAKEIHRCAKLLGFTEKDCKPWTSRDIINHYS